MIGLELNQLDSYQYSRLPGLTPAPAYPQLYFCRRAIPTLHVIVRAANPICNHLMQLWALNPFIRSGNSIIRLVDLMQSLVSPPTSQELHVLLT